MRLKLLFILSLLNIAVTIFAQPTNAGIVTPGTNDVAGGAATDLVQQYLHIPAPLMLMMVLNGLSLIIRKSPLPNWIIALLCVVGGIFAYPLITTGANTVFNSAETWSLRLTGALLGLGSLGIDLILEKIPWYRSVAKSISDASSDTIMIKKDDTTEKK